MSVGSLYNIKKNEVEKASLVLGKAFHEDPVWSQVFQSENERKEKLPLFFEISLIYALKYGKIYVTSENLEGIAIILPNNKVDMTFWRLFRAGPLKLLRIGLKLGKETGNRLEEILVNPISKVQKEILKRGYLYLQAIGISPKFQGQGFGGKLLKEICEAADNEELQIYLETTEENVKFYNKFGFRVLQKVKLPTIDLSMSIMVISIQ